MKKILSVIALIIIFSCSVSSDDDGNSNTTIIPIAPSNLIGTVASPTQINISWTDNSNNETGFKIQRRTGSATYSDVGTVNQDVLTFSDSGLLPSTTYIYRVYSYNSAGNSPTYSNEVTVTTNAVSTLPILTTTEASSITQNTVTSGGVIINDGGLAITARGVCWSTSSNPTILLATKTTNGAGIGAFTSSITGLTANTTYYVRAYATNSNGTAYGNEISFTTLQSPAGINIAGPNVTDIDGNIYESVSNCGITLTKQNLNVSKYSDGTPIPEVQDPTQWENLTTGAWCYFSNDPATEAVYGKLYNWYAVAGIYDSESLANPILRKKLVPMGWHVPTNAEWTQLTDCLSVLVGGKMKSTGTLSAGTGLWQSPNSDATNASGFTGRPGGLRYGLGTFSNFAINGYWWSSLETNTGASGRALYYNNGNSFSYYGCSKYFGFSVRCIRD